MGGPFWWKAWGPGNLGPPLNTALRWPMHDLVPQIPEHNWCSCLSSSNPCKQHGPSVDMYTIVRVVNVLGVGLCSCWNYVTVELSQGRIGLGGGGVRLGNVLGGNVRGELSTGGVVLGGNCPGGRCPGGNRPGGECPDAKCPGGNCPGGSCPVKP